MKLYKYTFLLFIINIVISCGDNMNFSNAPMNNVAHYDSIYFTKYNELPQNSFPAVNQYFTPKNMANLYLKDWLDSYYYSMDIGSTANVIYDFMNYDRTDSLNNLSQNMRVLGATEYRTVWGTPFVESFTPAKSPDIEIPKILSNETQTTNPYRVVQYNYSTQEPLIEYNKEFFYINQNFNALPGVTWDEFDVSGYFNNDLTAKGRRWMTYVINAGTGNKGVMGYCNFKLGGDVWLITGSVDLSAAISPKFTFDLGTGYYKGLDCLKVLISENFNGENPKEATWEDVTDLLGVKSNPWVTGYPTLYPMNTVDLKKYAGKRIYVALNYILPVKASNYDDATLYVVDNLKIYETRDIASISGVQTKYDVFKFQNGVWSKMNNLYILQDEDYKLINKQELSIRESYLYIPDILASKVQSVEKIVVVFKTSESTTYAENYIKINGKWEKEKLLPIINRMDSFIYKGYEEKWTYQETKDL